MENYYVAFIKERKKWRKIHSAWCDSLVNNKTYDLKHHVKVPVGEK